MRRFALIMAGGSGERFWPASRRLRPKQLLRLTDPGQSMIAEAVARIAPLVPRQNVIVATSEALADAIAEALPDVPRENIIGEPEKRNTAACLALAAAHLAERCGDPEDVSIAVLTADHRIGDPDRFRATVDTSLAFAEANDALVTIGVAPTRPETGYGYIEVDADAGDVRGPGRGEASPWSPEHPVPASPTFGIDPSELRVLPVARFREKPDTATALEYARSGRHWWNSGMFFWRASTFLEALAAHMPELSRATDAMRAAIREGDPGGARLREVFRGLADVSIDVGLMERATNVFVVPATFSWDDVGAWDALSRTRAGDAQGNVVEGDAVVIGSHDCVVYNEASGEEMAVVVIGLDNAVVVTTPDGVLVCRKDRAQDVRRGVAELRARGRDRLT